MPGVDDQAVLLITVAVLTVYVIGVGGTTAAAIGVRDRWRRQKRTVPHLDPRRAEVVLLAPALPGAVRFLRIAGWVAFPIALVLALFANLTYPWLAPLTVILMVGLNAFYFTAMQGMGEQLTLTTDGFRLGRAQRTRTVRWVHITDFMGAHVGPFRAIRMSEGEEWQDPNTLPNVIFYRLNRALVRPKKSIVRRFTGLTYFDGVIRNTFGVSTQQLLQTMRTCHRLALEEERPKMLRDRPIDAAITNPEG
jgi:hypothetical protein